MIIQHNIMAMSAYRNYMGNTNALSKNLEKLSSGYRINRAGDDAAGLAISEKMRAQITGLDAAQKNVQDGISLVQTAEGALQEVQDMLNRMVYLATQSANGTYDNEVDRANLQKEVDALSTEIDRIADSSNFNGIKLLDGSLGLNTDAISISGAAATETVAGAAVTIPDANFGTVAAGTAHTEGETKEQVNPSFSVDLTGLTATIEGKEADDVATLDIQFAGETFTLDLLAADADSNGTVTETELGDALVKASKNYKSSTGTEVTDPNAAAADGTHLALQGFAFTATNTNGVVKFEYAGKANVGAAWTPKTDTNDFDDTEAGTINGVLGSTVTVAAAPTVNDDDAGGELEVTVNNHLEQHALVDVEQARETVEGGLAGIHLTLTADMLTEGGKISIDGKEFTVTYEADADAATAENDIINLSNFKDGTDAEKIHAAVDQLSQKKQFDGQDGRKFKIGSVDADTIAIDQRVESDAGKELAAIEDIKALISASAADTAAKNAGTTIELDASKLVEGNTITVDGQAFVFSAKPDSVEGDAIGVDINNAAADLAAKLGEKFGDDNVAIDGNKVTIRAAEAEADAPVVLGKGLVLQIGDTAENFNQLAVSVEDMHVDALGIGDINIGSQEGAAVAVDKIKAAINSVSMTRGTLGATQNRLEHTANNLAVMEENIQDAESSIRDTDIAEEMMAYTKNNILIQSAQAMLAQANTIPQGVLQLLG